MNTKTRFVIAAGFLVLLLALGSWGIYVGKTGLGVGLITAALAVFAVRGIRTKKIMSLEKQGMNPFDERTYYITGKAAYAAYSTFLIVTGLIVLGGSLFGPQIQVNPYNMLGYVITALVFLYLVFYYYYNSKV